MLTIFPDQALLLKEELLIHMLKSVNLIKSKQLQGLRRLFDKYGAMLLGYLVETMGEGKLAEEYLIIVFTDLANNYAQVENYGWLQLRQFAKNKLDNLGLKNNDTETFPVNSAARKTWRNMTDEQRYVFYNVYNFGKPVESIARQLKRPEGDIRKILVEAFAVIRKS
jgi:hypothetical protein